MATFAPTYLHIEDQSHRHAGHYTTTSDAPSHLKIEMVSAAFTGLSKVKCHQLVYKALSAELAAGLHAVQLELNSPI